jgi:Protein of unknown function with PCYCGC motif
MWLAVAIVAAVIVGVFAYTRRGEPSLMSATTQAPAPTAAGAQTPVPAVVDPPRFAAFGPHPQPNLPPLPFDYGPPARPAEVVRAVYKFAAEHPEVLGYVPCYCGCEREGGHRGNDDCFVAARNTAGDVTQWDPHGVT